MLTCCHGECAGQFFSALEERAAEQSFVESGCGEWLLVQGCVVSFAEMGPVIREELLMVRVHKLCRAVCNDLFSIEPFAFKVRLVSEKRFLWKECMNQQHCVGKLQIIETTCFMIDWVGEMHWEDTPIERVDVLKLDRVGSKRRHMVQSESLNIHGVHQLLVFNEKRNWVLACHDARPSCGEKHFLRELSLQFSWGSFYQAQELVHAVFGE